VFCYSLISIRSAAALTARELEQTFPAVSPGLGTQSINSAIGRSNTTTAFSDTPRATTSLPSTESTSRSTIKRPFVPVTGHTWRFKKSKPVQIKKIPKTVWLLEKPSEDVELTDNGGYEDYAINDDMVLLKGEFDLISNHTEDDIRRELEALFMRKFPTITMYDFEFIKRERT
jgi:hypothetical protein